MDGICLAIQRGGSPADGDAGKPGVMLRLLTVATEGVKPPPAIVLVGGCFSLVETLTKKVK